MSEWANKSVVPSPLVSIIINNFNYAPFLGRAIESALNQNYKNVEVIVVDDLSSDNSKAVIQSYGSDINAVFHSENQGQGAALNNGFVQSRGDIVIFVDADDYLYPEAVLRVVNAWRPGLSKLHYRLDLVDANEQFIDWYPAPEIPFDNGDVVPLLLSEGRYQTSVTTGNAFARHALSEIMPIPETDFRICADGYLVTLVPFYGEVQSIEVSLGAYRQHSKSNWSSACQSMGEKFRREITHDLIKHKYLSAKASQLGLNIAPDPAMADYQQLASRFASLRLEPERHPVKSDTRLHLMRCGLRASRTARLPWTQRLLTGLWFTALGVAPKQCAWQLIRWRYVKKSRPAALDRLFSVIRQTAQRIDGVARAR